MSLKQMHESRQPQSSSAASLIEQQAALIEKLQKQAAEKDAEISQLRSDRQELASTMQQQQSKMQEQAAEMLHQKSQIAKQAEQLVTLLAGQPKPEKPQPGQPQGSENEEPVILDENLEAELDEANEAMIQLYLKKYPDAPEQLLRAGAEKAKAKAYVVSAKLVDDEWVIDGKSIIDYRAEYKAFQDILPVMWEYFAQSCAMNEKRSLADRNVLAAPARFQADMDRLEAAYLKVEAADRRHDKCKPWQLQAKKEAERDLKEARAELADPFKAVVAWGIDRTAIYPHLFDSACMGIIRRRATGKAVELSRAADAERKNSRPVDIPLADPEAYKATKQAFKDICRGVDYRQRVVIKRILKKQIANLKPEIACQRQAKAEIAAAIEGLL